jgi:hypothetical protein
LASDWPSRIAPLLLGVAIAGSAPAARAKVFLTREEALEWAFPDADDVEAQTHVLTDAQASEVESLARARLDSKLVTLYTGRRHGEVVGYAYIDIHTVRTLPEACLVVLDPEGNVRHLRMLAFYEPEEYLPGGRWLSQFEGREPADPLRLEQDVHGIAGATLSAQAVTSSVRRARAVQQVLVREGI